MSRFMTIAARFCGAVLLAVVCLAVVRGADPGADIPNSSELSDQRPGSVLFFPYYSSSAADPEAQDAAIAITNTHHTLSAFIELYLVDGATGAVSRRTLCLTPNQTTRFRASEVDPGVRGYILGVAVDQLTGCPVRFNHLIGSAALRIAKLVEGQLGGMLAAESIAAINDPPAVCSSGASSATLNFDGVRYNRLPRTLVLDKVRAEGSGHQTLLIVNRFPATLLGAATTLGGVAGELFDEAGTSHPFSFDHGAPQLAQMLSDALPGTTPVFGAVLPDGRAGWLQLAGTDQAALIGAALTFHPGIGSNPRAYRGARNLRHTTLAAPLAVTIPLGIPSC